MQEVSLLNVAEAAIYLNVKKSWLYAHARELPAIKLGHGLRFRVTDLNAYLTTQTVGHRAVS